MPSRPAALTKLCALSSETGTTRAGTSSTVVTATSSPLYRTCGDTSSRHSCVHPPAGGLESSDFAGVNIACGYQGAGVPLRVRIYVVGSVPVQYAPDLALPRLEARP